jgi:hypothetical protein
MLDPAAPIMCRLESESSDAYIMEAV